MKTETPRYHTRNHPETNNPHYVLNCYVCGGPVHIIEEAEQPHRCRIDLDAQKNRIT